MEVSGQLHAPATLPSGKEPHYVERSNFWGVSEITAIESSVLKFCDVIFLQRNVKLLM
jgi:hypothetical protein